MGRFIVRRLLQMTFVLWAVSVLTFFIFNVIPNGDPAVRMAGKNPTETQIEAIRKEWGFDRSLPAQYVTTMRKALTGDLESYRRRIDVNDEIWRRLPVTLSLALGAFVLSVVLGVAFGVVGALYAGRWPAARRAGALDRRVRGVTCSSSSSDSGTARLCCSPSRCWCSC